MLTLSTTQAKAVKKAAQEPTRAALFAFDTGQGKTLAAVELSKALDAETIILIAPENTHKAWRDTFTGQGVDLPWKPVTSKTVAENWPPTKPGVYVFTNTYFALAGTDATPKRNKTTGEMSKGRVKVLDYAKLKPGTPDLVIVDEAHKGMASKHTAMFKALMKMKQPGYKLLLTATPQGSKFENIWQPTYWLWPNIVDRSKNRWIAVWCATVFNPHTFTRVKADGERNPGAYLKSLPCVLRMEATRTPVEELDVRLNLPPKQRKMWDEMAQTSVAWMLENDEPLVAGLPIVQRVRLRQMALGEVTLTDDGSVTFAEDCESVKIKAVQWVQERHPGENLLVLTDSAKFARVAAKRLGGHAWTGETKPAERERLRNSPDNGVLVATYAAIAEGVDGLQKHCHIEVVLNRSDSVVLNEQAAGRLNRRGQEAEKIYRYNIIAKNTLDDDHFEHMANEAFARKEELG